MKGLIGNCVVGQSGGPTTAINASLAGVVGQAKKSPEIKTIYGMVNGIVGLINDHLCNLSELSDEQLDILKHTPASYLHTCRYKLPSAQEAPDVYEKIFERFKKYDIKYFFYIGGNDSMDTVMKVSNYAKEIGYEINVIGVPKTVDNDLLITDHTPGFGSAAKYIATSVMEAMYDCNVYDMETVTIFEMMGRNAGWMAAAAALARQEEGDAPHLIYLPEIAVDFDKCVEDIKEVQKKIKNVIVCVSEGCKTADGKFLGDTGVVDSFGHKQLSGAARTLGNYVAEKLGCRVRVLELGVLQRCACHTASKTDLDESEMIGQAGVKAAIDGQTGMMMIYVRQPGDEYKITIDSYDINKIANGEKKVPREWINEAGNDVTEECIKYMRPLIMGECELRRKNGLPVYAKLK